MSMKSLGASLKEWEAALCLAMMCMLLRRTSALSEHGFANTHTHTHVSTLLLLLFSWCFVPAVAAASSSSAATVKSFVETDMVKTRSGDLTTETKKTKKKHEEKNTRHGGYKSEQLRMHPRPLSPGVKNRAGQNPG